MSEKIIYRPSVYDDDPRDELGEISSLERIRNAILIGTSIIYCLAMLLPFMSQPVMDAGPIPTSLLSYGLMFLGFLSNIAENISVAALIAILIAACIIMTVVFVVSSIKNYKRYADGDASLFGRNVFYLVSIPAIYLLVMGYFAVDYDVYWYAMAHIGFFLTVLTGALSVILLIILSIDRSKVRPIGIISVVLSVVCFVLIFNCLNNPIFDVSAESAEGGNMIYEVSFDSFERFYDLDYIEDHLRDVEKYGKEKVFTDAYFRAQHFVDKAGGLAKALMLELPMYVPALMLISLFVMILSSAAASSALLTKFSLANKKKRGIIISKSILAVSTAVFAWSQLQILSAVDNVKMWLNTLPDGIDTTFHTLEMSLNPYPILAIAAAIVLLILNVRPRRSHSIDS